MEMNFKEYFSGLDPEKKTSLATNADTSVAYLSQVANGHRNAGAGLIRRLMQADKNITFSMMSPVDKSTEAA